MNTQDQSTTLDSQRCQRQPTGQTLLYRSPQHLAYHAFARHAYQQRQLERSELLHAIEQAQVVLNGLAETKTGIDQQSLTVKPLRLTGCNAGAQIIKYCLLNRHIITRQDRKSTRLN